MSSTRHAESGSGFHQGRYMSSPDLERGLLANCVASKCRAVESPQQRKLIWFLQWLSHRPGGLEKAALEMVELFPDRFIPTAVRQLGYAAGRVYSFDEVYELRRAVDGFRGGFFMRGEVEIWDDWQPSHIEERSYDEAGWITARKVPNPAVVQAKARADDHPVSYPAEAFVKHSRAHAAEHFGKFLMEELCLNPAVGMENWRLWYLPELEQTLTDYHAVCVKRAGAACTTEIGEKIGETLDYALEGRCMAVIDGLARTGKTFAVKAWCDTHPGEARYIQAPSTNDDISFFRAICESLGLANGSAFKAVQLRERIVETVKGLDLMLVFDEAHYLWPQRNLRKAVPHRINWILTQLVNLGVPVALVTTPQFTKNQQTVEKHGGWSSEQLVGRIGHYERLPDCLSEADMLAVARTFLPEADADCLRVLTAYAHSSAKYLAGIETLARRAIFVAKKAGRPNPTLPDLSAALKEGVVPSDTALLSALSEGRRTAPARRDSEPVQARGKAPASAVHGRGNRPASPLSPPSRGMQPAAPAEALQT